MRGWYKDEVRWKDLQFNMGLKPWQEPGIFHFLEIVFLAKANASVCEQKYLTKAQVQSPLNKSPASHPETN